VRDEGPVRVNMCLDSSPLCEEFASVCIDSRKLLGVRDKLRSNAFDFFVGGDVVGTGIKMMSESRFPIVVESKTWESIITRSFLLRIVRSDWITEYRATLFYTFTVHLAFLQVQRL
jgi:hypothetical protein